MSNKTNKPNIVDDAWKAFKAFADQYVRRRDCKACDEAYTKYTTTDPLAGFCSECYKKVMELNAAVTQAIIDDKKTSKRVHVWKKGDVPNKKRKVARIMPYKPPTLAPAHTCTLRGGKLDTTGCVPCEKRRKAFKYPSVIDRQWSPQRWDVHDERYKRAMKEYSYGTRRSSNYLATGSRIT